MTYLPNDKYFTAQNFHPPKKMRKKFVPTNFCVEFVNILRGRHFASMNDDLVWDHKNAVKSSKAGDHLVFVVPTSGLEGMSATDQHPGFLGLGDHSDVVLALRLMVRLLLPRLS